MEQITIEGILDQPLIQLVKNAPSNPITRGQIRAATNLVIPDGVITTEGITQYVLDNYDASKAPKRIPLLHGIYGGGRRSGDMPDYLFELCDVTGRQDRYYRSMERYNADIMADVPFLDGDFDGCTSKTEVMAIIDRKIYEALEMDGGVQDEEYSDTIDRDLEETDNLEAEYDSEEIWSEHGQAIAASLGLDMEDMEINT